MTQLAVTFFLTLILFSLFCIVLWFKNRNQLNSKPSPCHQGCGKPTCQCIKKGGQNGPQPSD